MLGESARIVSIPGVAGKNFCHLPSDVSRRKDKRYNGLEAPAPDLREDWSMTRRLLTGLLLTGLVFVLVARADDPAKDSGGKIDSKAASDAAAGKQDRLANQFREFENALLRLKQRLAESSRPEDKQKAVILQKAIEKANQEGIDTKFDKLRQLVQDSKTFDDLQKIQAAID
jgi:hypothetical protein